MAYTNGNGQTRVGVRIVPLSVVIPTISALLDSYSGASAAYSLRKLSATWSGSAIRVRRSSDNTEQDIGFDSNGNLDTVALSTFVGSGSGFVTTWYDQTGNNFNRAQATAAAQPNIVYLGAINMVNGKPAIYFDPNVGFALQGPRIGETYMGAGFSSTILNVTKLDSIYSTTEEYPLFGGMGWYDSRFSIYNNKWYLINTGTGISSTVNASVNQVVSSVVFEYTTDKVRINGTEVISGNVGINGGTGAYYLGRSYLGKSYKGYFQEHIIYASDKTSVISAMESNMNTYYSAYPNPTSVWNLLNAVYSADTIASSSLKTSLFAAYNGESNTNDSFGTNNGTAQGGLTYTAGKIGNAFTFNGSNAYVSIPNNSLNFTGDFSYSFWVKTNTSGNYVVLGNYTYTGGLNYGYAISLRGNDLYFQITNGATIVSLIYTNSSGWSSQYNHITITRKNSTGSEIYVNGTKVISNTSSVNPLYTSTHYSTIGIAQDPAFYWPFNGQIDALNIWTKELTASEVSELYNSGNGAQYIGDNFYKPTTNDALLVNNGTAQGGLTYGLGKVGTAFQFNGTNAYVSLPNNSLNFTGDFSVSLWLYRQPLAGGMLVSNWYNGSTPYGWYIYNTNGVIQFLVGNGTSSPVCSFNSSVLTSNVWNFVTVTKKATSAKIYINGVLNTSATLSSSVVYTTTHYPMIGAAKYDTGSPTFLSQNGDKIDEVNIWNKELSASEVTELYNSGNGKQYPN